MLRTAASLTVFAAAASAHAASIQWIDGLRPDGSITASAVSADGTAIVGSAFGLGSINFAIRWTAGGGLENLGPLNANSVATYATCVNADGTVVAGGSSLDAPGEKRLAWRWTRADGMIPLGDFDGGPVESEARGISNDGQTIIGVGRDAEWNRAFLWKESTGLVELPDLASGLPGSSEAFAISHDGSLVCGVARAEGYVAVVWPNGADPVAILGGEYAFYANGLSADGSVYIGARATYFRSVRWTQATGWTELASQSEFAEAHAISADGEIIVGNIKSGACMWVGAGPARLLTTILTEDYGVDTTGMTLFEATGISADGQVIVGNGTFGSSTQRVFRIVLPRPGVCCLDGACYEPAPEKLCAEVGGLFVGFGSDCATVDCAAVGACCFACPSSTTEPCPGTARATTVCAVLSAAQCADLSGSYAGDGVPCTGACACPADITGDGLTDSADFNALAGHFGTAGPECETRAHGDLNCDGVVNTADFNILALDFGCGS